MTIHIAILGIDGSGKSTVSSALPAYLAARLGIEVAWAGSDFGCLTPSQDLLDANLNPRKLPRSARLATRLRRLAKRLHSNRLMYPLAKLLQMALQDSAARRLSEQQRPRVVVSDGNALLSALGRAANYVRPASGPGKNAKVEPSALDLKSAIEFILEGSPMSDAQRRTLPDLRRARFLKRLAGILRCDGVWLPDAVVLLDLEPETALRRIENRGAEPDRHENAADLAQARRMYLKTLEAYRLCRPRAFAMEIRSDHSDPGAILAKIADGLKGSLLHPRNDRKPSVGGGETPLGGSAIRTTGSSVGKRILNPRYLRYLLRQFAQGAWREPFFPLSRFGRRFIREGYSSSIMLAIYQQRTAHLGWVDRVFFGYPLHRAVSDRLDILSSRIERELRIRLRNGGQVKVLTAPSGFAEDLLRPLRSIAESDPEAASRVRIVACDLDPAGRLCASLTRQASSLGADLRFIQGDLTDPSLRQSLACQGPYDLALFVGLSSWLPKPALLGHLQSLGRSLVRDGLLAVDAFCSSGYAESGRLMGYRANYYAPEVFRTLLDSAGFEGRASTAHAGCGRLNHVLFARPRAIASGL